MCGRFQLVSDIDIEEINRIIEEVQGNVDMAAFKTGEIYPTDSVPVFVKGETTATPQLAVMKWGFPRWDNKGVIINARSETASEKPSFSRPLRQNRCVVPANGFYEWKHVNRRAKEKYFFSLKDAPALYMAGIYDTFKNENGRYPAFAIFTTESDQCMREIHGRMPVMLYRHEIQDYLSDFNFAAAILRRTGVALEKTAV